MWAGMMPQRSTQELRQMLELRSRTTMQTFLLLRSSRHASSCEPRPHTRTFTRIHTYSRKFWRTRHHRPSDCEPHRVLFILDRPFVKLRLPTLLLHVGCTSPTSCSLSPMVYYVIFVVRYASNQSYDPQRKEKAKLFQLRVPLF